MAHTHTHTHRDTHTHTHRDTHTHTHTHTVTHTHTGDTHTHAHTHTHTHTHSGTLQARKGFGQSVIHSIRMPMGYYWSLMSRTRFVEFELFHYCHSYPHTHKLSSPTLAHKTHTHTHTQDAIAQCRFWVKEIDRHLDPDRVAKLLVGNKIDLKDEREVSYESAKVISHLHVACVIHAWSHMYYVQGCI